jgi:hypothetical protein
VYIFKEKDEDFDVYAKAIDKKSEFFVAKIDYKDSRRRFQTGSIGFGFSLK